MPIFRAMETKEKQASEILTLDALLPQTLFIVPIPKTPIYPGMMAPVVLNHPKLIETVDAALSNRGIVGLLMTNENTGDPLDAFVLAPKSVESELNTGLDENGPSSKGIPNEIGEVKKSLYAVGTAVRVLKKLQMGDGSMTVLVQSLKRFEAKKLIREEPLTVVQAEYKEDIVLKDKALDAIIRSVLNQIKELSQHNPFLTEELKMAILNTTNPGSLADLIAFAIGLNKKSAQHFLETLDVYKRFEMILIHLKKEQQLVDIQKKINEDVGNKVQKLQREFFLKEQLKSIKKELSSGASDENAPDLFETYREKMESLKLSPEAKKAAAEELAKLEATSESSPEFNVIRNYLDWMLALPWGNFSADSLDLKKARKTLDEDHYGIPKVKERILEFLAVKKLKPDSKGSILCLVGPPGVGKTSLGKSIAKAMGRNFFRFSLGGMRDEAEIKGHRRTYIGAMPGKILNALKRAGTMNPILMLDEIDKLGASFQGDPASALLEVLDPEQNNAFLDHYLDVPFDLSNALFVMTANTTATIPAALLDRMEVVELSGYTFEEKQEIALKYVLPKELENHGLKPDFIRLPKETLERLISGYSREPGMRSLQQKITSIARKVALKVVENPKLKQITVEPKDLYEYLGPERFEDDLSKRVDIPGVVVGLAWTAMGGQTLFVEASDVPKAVLRAQKNHKSQPAVAAQPLQNPGFGQLKITGQIGDVMSESAALAYSFVKKKTKASKKARKFFEENEIHLHIPAGAIPKDGPSAGVTMATALLSLITGKKVKKDLAMTGELSLVGKVLPVGGIKEKVLAAKRAGIKTIILPKQNKKDLREIPERNLKGLKVVFAEKVEDVFRKAFVQ